MRAPLLLLLGAPVALAGCDQLVPTSKSPELELAEKIVALRDQGFLRTREDVPEAPADAPRFFERLDEIDRWLDRADSWEEALPDWLDPQNRRTILERLQRLEPFFEQMTALLDEPWVQDSLVEARPFAYRTSIRHVDGTDHRQYDAYATPDLERMDRWIELLCADAMVRAGEDLVSERTIRSLSQALDLLRLLDDGQLQGSHACTALESIVLLTIRYLAPGTRLDPVQTRAALEPRLARMADERRVWDCLQREVSYRIEIAEVLLTEPGRADEDHWLAILDVSRARIVKRSLDVTNLQDLLRSAPVLCARLEFFGEGHPLSPLLDAVDAIHTLFVEAELARLGLAINAYRFVEGDWPQYRSSTEKMFELPFPRQPCRMDRTTYDRGFNWVKLTSASRSGRLPTEEDLTLFWFWGENLYKAFEARDPVGVAAGPR